MVALEEQIRIMPSLSYRDGDLFMDQVRLSEISGEVGTPVYCYSKREIVRRWRRLGNAFSEVAGSLLMAASLKANANPELVRFLVPMGAGADITSSHELAVAFRAGVPSNRIVFAGVGKKTDELVAALEAGIFMFNVESEQEYNKILHLARQMGVKPPISFRVNPNVDGYTHKLTTKGLYQNKFGIEPDRIKRLVEIGESDVIGLQVHIGSPIYDLGQVVHAFGRVVELYHQLPNEKIRYLDIGGQVPIDYGDGKFDVRTSTPEHLANQIVPTLNELGLNLVLEPGRFLFGPAGLLVSEVLYNKENPEKNFLIVDATMSQADRGPRYGAQHTIVPVQSRSYRPSRVYDVVGGVCESSDRQRTGVTLPEMGPGELLAILSYGAYGYSMASNYNGQPRPPEVLIDGDNWRVIRLRETSDDMFTTLEV